MKEKHIEKINREINETIIPIMNDWSIFNEDDMQRMLKNLGIYVEMKLLCLEKKFYQRRNY